MGNYVRAAPLIVIADINTLGRPKFEQVLTVREVLRGDARVGERITIPSGLVRYIVPREAQNVAVLFTRDWQKSSFPVAEVYQQPAEIAALREFITIYALSDERAQLLALQARASDANPLFATQLIADFARMREPQNFDVVLSSFDLLDEVHRASLLELLERIGDERALPLLIAALRSPQPKVSYSAWHALSFYFPGAPGVTEAFRRLGQDPATRDLAFSYLSKHDAALAATFPQPMPNLWQQAQQQVKEGNLAAAQSTYFALIEKESEANWTSLEAARTLLPLLDQGGKVRLRGLLSSMLARQTATSGGAEGGVAMLRALRHESNTAALLHLLHDPRDAPYSTWDSTARAATFALLELSPAARQSATTRVLQKIQTRLVPGAKLRFNEETLYFCQLAWLADDATWQTAIAKWPKNLSLQLTALQALRDATTAKNEAAALATLLPDNQNRWQGDSNRWIIARLGDLRDPVAVDALFGELVRSRFSGTSGDIKAALISIGGTAAGKATVESGALGLLRHEAHDLRASAMDILRALQNERMRPLLRRILTENDLGDRAHAVFLLGYVGQPEDLPLLVPLADFWKGDRAIQARAASAIVGIRERFAYDVHGPIATSKAATPSGVALPNESR
jgi:HEAT repeat protein